MPESFLQNVRISFITIKLFRACGKFLKHENNIEKHLQHDLINYMYNRWYLIPVKHYRLYLVISIRVSLLSQQAIMRASMVKRSLYKNIHETSFIGK